MRRLRVASGLPNYIVNQWFTAVSSALRPQNFLRVALGEPEYLLYFQRNHLKTRRLRQCGQLASVLIELPIFTRISLSMDAGYPQFSPSELTKHPQRMAHSLRRDFAGLVALHAAEGAREAIKAR